MEITECPLCKAPSLRVLDAASRTFRQCDACDLIWVPRQWHLTPEEEVDRYRKHDNSVDNAGYVTFLRRAIEPLAADDSIRRVLDYGSGPSPVLVSLLSEAGYQAVGYDPFFSPDADLSRPFDAVVSIETFEHFSRPAEEMRRIADLVRPGGLLVVVTRLHSGLDAMSDWWYARDPTHVAFYSRQTMKWIGECFGFSLEHANDTDLVVLRRCSS